MEKLGLGPLGKRLLREAAEAAEWWNKAFGRIAFLKSFSPDHPHEAHCIAAEEKRAVLAERLKEVVGELHEQSKLFSDRADIELGVAKMKLIAIAKAASTSVIAKPPGGGGGEGTGKGGAKRKRTAELTDRDKEILKEYSNCHRNAAEAARQLNITRQYVWDVVEKSKARYAKLSAPGRSVQTQALPKTDRGGAAISSEPGASDKGLGRKQRVKQKF
ncbi:MAG: hypothetical protein HY287_15915 [Planctomycetes bacterium]|nr:hypothetical protein [Planctomycetota bacterium]MBI3835812.1 hypothetical protein [Planctomycetota bacterium]